MLWFELDALPRFTATTTTAPAWP